MFLQYIKKKVLQLLLCYIAMLNLLKIGEKQGKVEVA